MKENRDLEGEREEGEGKGSAGVGNLWEQLMRRVRYNAGRYCNM